ncbi:protein Brevis radix-like 1 [Typha latifolia]|uniref:protein Brevis radix-like 1 n=1 Tax=Typha latifolia TaxID=4733 RepID=UPI003C2C1988
MFACIPCPGTKGLIKEITNHIKVISFKVGMMQKRSKGKYPKEVTIIDVEEEEEEEEEEWQCPKEEKEWVAEPETGVLITLVSLPSGGNYIKRIRFREELYDSWGAQSWWTQNYDKIVELYSITQGQSPKIPYQSEDECHSLPAKAHEPGEASETSHDSCDSSSSSKGGPTTSNREVIQGKVVEWVIEDEPGVFITIRSTPNGSKELLRVELRERFGEVKARVWWEENKTRLQKLYS